MGTLLLVATGCPGGGNSTDGGGTGTDGGVVGPDGGTVTGDGGTVGPQGCQLASGCVGGPCTQDSDCKEAKTPGMCWKQVLLNNPKYVPTPGGYCSASCTSDADCGTGYCFRPPGETGSYCMARCSGPNTCRHPGYACTYEGAIAICFPDTNLDCSPLQGSCDAPLANGSTTPGGCIRAAYEDKGICHIACAVGTKTCPPDSRFGSVNPPAQHCVFLDTTVDAAGQPSPTGDKFKGPVCLDLSGTPTAAGQPCTYWDECQDGYQCDRYGSMPADRVCRRLCAQGPTGMQDKTLYIAPGGTAFTNMCDGANQVCANELQAGLQDGLAGLCLTKQ